MIVVALLLLSAVQMHIWKGSALYNIDDYNTLTHFGVDALWCDSPRSLFSPMCLSHQRSELRAYLQGSRRPTSTHTIRVRTWVILRYSRIKSLRDGPQTGALVTGTAPLFQCCGYLVGQLGDLLALTDSAWRYDRMVSLVFS